MSHYNTIANFNFADVIKIHVRIETNEFYAGLAMDRCMYIQELKKHRAVVNWQNEWSRDSKWVAGACTWLDQTFPSMALIRTRKGVQAWLSFSVFLAFAPIDNNRHVQKHMQSRAARDTFARRYRNYTIIVCVQASMQRHRSMYNMW